MTLFDDQKSKCSVCGNVSSHPTLLSTNQHGYQDLDLRPAEMYRSTIHIWLEECPYCGYVATYLKDKLTIDRNYLKSEEYTTCDGIDFESSTSKKFYRRYLIEKRNNDDRAAFNRILECAWTCDDSFDTDNSKLAREIAIEIADKIIESDRENADNMIVMKSDLLRRIGAFDQLIEEYKNLTLGDAYLNRIIRFQVKKAYEKDDGCYTLEVVK